MVSIGGLFVRPAKDDGYDSACIFNDCVCEFFDEVSHGIVSFYV